MGFLDFFKSLFGKKKPAPKPPVATPLPPTPPKPPTPPPPITPPVPPTTPTPKKLYVNVDVLNIRSTPEVTTYNKTGSLTRDQEVVFLESSGAWTRVQLPSGGEGWVSSEFLVDSRPPHTVSIGITSAQLSGIVPTLKLKLEEYTIALNKTMQEFAINTPLRQAAFIAQTAHESIGYSALVENLNYSAQALLNTWPNRFTPEEASLYARQPEKIANRVYANRIGNGSESSGDGWRYRGRGIIQVTGKDNYRACGLTLNLDLVTHPELLEQPIHAFRSGGWYWNSRALNPLADIGDFITITKKINGGLNGLDDRMVYYAKAKAILGVV